MCVLCVCVFSRKRAVHQRFLLALRRRGARLPTGASGGMIGAAWSGLGRPCGFLRASWEPLGSLLGTLGASWEDRGASAALLGPLGVVSWGHDGTVAQLDLLLIFNGVLDRI